MLLSEPGRADALAGQDQMLRERPQKGSVRRSLSRRERLSHPDYASARPSEMPSRTIPTMTPATQAY